MRLHTPTGTASIQVNTISLSGEDVGPVAATRGKVPIKRGLQPLTFENDGLAIVMIIIVCSMVVLGLIFTVAIRILRRLVDWWVSKKAEHRALSSTRKVETSPEALPVSMLHMDVIDIGPIEPQRVHLRPPISFSALRRAALFHRPSSALSTIPSQAEEGSRSIPSVPSMAMEEDWRRISNVSSTPPRQSSHLSFCQAVPETSARSHCSVETVPGINNARE